MAGILEPQAVLIGRDDAAKLFLLNPRHLLNSILSVEKVIGVHLFRIACHYGRGAMRGKRVLYK
ncbi:hypothetical protein D3C87_1751520 [compost metagenome]